MILFVLAVGMKTETKVMLVLVGRDVGGAAAVAGGGLGPLDVQVEQLHL